MSSLRTSVPWANRLLCLNSSRGLCSIKFMVTWLVITYTPLHSLLKAENSTSENNERYSVKFEQVARYYRCSAAFDTVEHSILLNRLSSKRDLNGTALDWFRSYLSGRSQRVSVRGAWPAVRCSSRLVSWPTFLYSLCKGNGWCRQKTHLPTVHCDDDDSQLYISFSPKATLTRPTQLLLSNITFKIDIKQWMCQDKLLMKDAKTELLLIGTRQQLAKVTIDSITIGRSIIAPQSPVRNLGLWLDSNLSMGDHMTKTSSAAFYYCTISRD